MALCSHPAYLDADRSIRDCEDDTKFAEMTEEGILFWHHKQKRQSLFRFSEARAIIELETQHTRAKTEQARLELLGEMLRSLKVSIA